MRSDSIPERPSGAPLLNQHNSTILDILDRVTYAAVKPGEDENPVYRLRYEAYRREESVPFNDAGVVVDNLDDEPNAKIFGVYIDGQLVSSLRVHHVHPGHRKGPSMKTHPDVLEPMLEKGESFIDPSRFTADFEASLKYPALPLLTLRLAVMASIYHDVDWCLALVRPAHGAFYRRVFGSVELAGPRSYPGLTFPVSLFGANVESRLTKTLPRYPFMYSTESEREALFGGGYRIPVQASSRQAVLQVVDAEADLAAAQ